MTKSSSVSLLVGGVIGKIEKQKTADVIQFEKQARVGFLARSTAVVSWFRSWALNEPG